MIISLKYEFIYLRTKKTASTAIHRALEKILGPWDVCIRAKHGDLSPILKRRVALPEDGFNTHISASEIKPYLRNDIWENSFKFTSERHPYEKAVSLAYFAASKQQKVAEKGRRVADSFEALLDRVVRDGRYSSFPAYSIDGIPIVSDFIRHESIEDDVKRIGAKLGFEFPPLEQLKATQRQDRRPAREILTKAQRETIYKTCKSEFELLGYEP